MKMLSKSAIIFVLLAICLPVRGEILIYKMTLKCLMVSEDDELWDVEEDVDRAYLVIDVAYDPNGAVSEIRDANQVEYKRSGRNKWFWRQDRLLSLEAIELEKIVLWIFMERDFSGEGAELLVLTGKAKNMDIGLGRDEKREVARAAKGEIHADWVTDDGILQICTISLRLHSKWTKQANDVNEGDQDFSYAVFDIVTAYFEDRNYHYVFQ